jgi:hypothetical protein
MEPSHDAVDAAAGTNAPSVDGAADVHADAEVLEGLPVVAETTVLEAARPPSLPAVQAATLAATGFVAGAATAALVSRRRTRSGVKRRTKKKGAVAGPFGEIVSSKSFLVDVHLLRRD